MRMRKNVKQFTAFLLSFVLVASSFNGITLVNADETVSVEQEEFGYVMYATSYEEGAITFDASNVCINGNLMTNGTVEHTGNFNHNGSITTSENEIYHIIYQKINDTYFTGNYEIYEEDKSIDDMNININTAMMVYGVSDISGNINLNSYIQSMSDVNMSGDNLNANNVLIMSKYGDINITNNNVSITGLIYAPFGTVTIDCSNCNLNNVVVIAHDIKIKCANLNVNYNSNVGNIVGIDTENIYCAEEEWKYIKDTDADGLNDYYEMCYTFTDYLDKDSDDNGVIDADEDFDADNLINMDEYNNRTHPLSDDTDDDEITDGNEIGVYHSNPLLPDTDDDGLLDGDELILATDMFDKDTDDDGIIDSQEFYEQVFIENVKDGVVESIEVNINCTGNVKNTMEIESVFGDDVMSTNVVGLVGEPYDITTTSDFESATLSYKIEEEYLTSNSIEELLFLWYDEENCRFVPLETTYDIDNNKVMTTVSHFSKYMLVNSREWFKSWFEENDYDGGVDGESVVYNTVLAIDCSGSMSTNDSIQTDQSTGIKSCKRIEAAANYISFKKNSDKLAVVTFNGSAKVLVSMTSDASELILALQKLSDNGGTSINAALATSVNLFSNSELEDENAVNIIILLSDGNASCGSSYLRMAKEKGIIIHTVGLGDDCDESVLKRIADYTGGQYMKAITADELVGIYSRLGESEIDTTDTDGDGLYDVVEKCGIKLYNGDVIYTNPNRADSDGDGLLDGEEVNPELKDVREDYIGGLSSGIAKLFEAPSQRMYYYFEIYSDPNSKDSDGDGYNDYDEVNVYDSNPLRSDVKIYELDNEYVSVYYEKAENEWRTSYGGDQDWLYDSKTGLNNKDLEDFGCGVIAFSDEILYLSKSSSRYETKITDEVEMLMNGGYEYESYVEYVLNMDETYVGTTEGGPLGTELVSGMNKYFKSYDIDYRASWKVSKDKIYSRIKDMVTDDIPVILSIGPAKILQFSKKKDKVSDEKVNLYVKNDYEYVVSQKTNNHYVIVTGIVKDKITDDIWLRVSSWGEMYYINYDEYLDYIGDGSFNDFRGITSNVIYIN